MTNRSSRIVVRLVTALAVALPFAANAEALLRVDASAPPPALLQDHLRMGTAVAPSGRVVGINSRYLTLDGKPWLPVMGEFHYSRFPESYWEEELLKMKAAGINIVSAYVIWQHHEEFDGRFDWSGDRDLRRFVELCAKHGLYFFVRVGPWVHAEVRFGGIPDWIVNSMPTREDDPDYLSHVERFYAQIGQQLAGLLWKDGGPIIGVQLENEYNLAGERRGRQHIATLKALARKAGLDAPLYTVTGWDKTIYPPGEVVPVFGDYPDKPWSNSNQKLPPRETYAFRFASRNNESVGDQVPTTSAGDAEADAARTPFLGAEYGGGVPAMYRRRPVIVPDDIGAMLPVQLGSGVNLYGYYMFHGGRNPPGTPSREESTAIGGYNDLPMIGYDFGAPLGQYGQVQPAMTKIRPFHYFLDAFGSQLAPMTAHRPEVLPTSAGDLSTPRFSVRSDGERAFLFFNNYVRQYAMAAQRGVRFEVKLAAATIRLPSEPVDIPSGAYFIWPINLDLGDARLAWATAQPLTKLKANGHEAFVFLASDKIPVEFAFDAGVSVQSRFGKVSQQDGRTLVRDIKPGRGESIRLKTRSGAIVSIVVLPGELGNQAVVAVSGGARRLFLSEDDLYFDGDAIELRSRGDAGFAMSVFPAPPDITAATGTVRRTGKEGVFDVFTSKVPSARTLETTMEKLRDGRSVPPVPLNGPEGSASQPPPEVFGRSAAWKISVPRTALAKVNDVYLQIDYAGDVGRLFSGTSLIDDHYYNGQSWEVGLKRFAALLDEPLTLTVLPLRADAPVYIDDQLRPKVDAGGQIADVVSVKAIPEYRQRLELVWK